MQHWLQLVEQGPCAGSLATAGQLHAMVQGLPALLAGGKALGAHAGVSRDARAELRQAQLHACHGLLLKQHLAAVRRVRQRLAQRRHLLQAADVGAGGTHRRPMMASQSC